LIDYVVPIVPTQPLPVIWNESFVFFRFWGKSQSPISTNERKQFQCQSVDCWLQQTEWWRL